MRDDGATRSEETRPPDTAAGAGEAAAGVEKLLAGYVGRINAGERIDASEVRAACPEHAEEILAQLSAFEDIELLYSAEAQLGTLGDYTLCREIGRGGMGVVYEARQNSLDRKVALKVLPAGIAVDPKSSSRFLREAQIAGRLHHPQIVPVYGFGVEAGTPYYAMELVQGGALSQILERLRSAEGDQEARKSALRSVSRLLGWSTEAGIAETVPAGKPREEGSDRNAGAAEEGREREPGHGTGESASAGDETQVLRSAPTGRPLEEDADRAYCLSVAAAFAAVAEGLQHAHSRRVIHRDIKPSNLIVDEGSEEAGSFHGRVRILDFGLARLEGQESITGSGEFLGTPLYMSPEQARARKVSIDHRTDIYSLGATLYEMLTLRPPFKGKDHQDTVSQILSKDPRPPRQLNPRVPRDLETIALKCLRKEPGERYGTAEALAQDLRRFVRGDPIEARPQPFLEKMGRRLCRNRLRVAAAGLLGLLLLTSGLLLLRYRRDLEAENLAEYREKIFSAIGKMELGRWSRRAERRSFPGTRSARAVVARSAPPGSEGESAALLSTAFAAEAEYGDTVRDPVEEAAEDLRRAAALLPGKPEAHFYFARSQRLLGRDEAAKERLDRALGCDPGFFPALIERESASGRADEEVVARLEHALAAAGQAGIAKDSILAYRAKAKREWQEAEKALGRLLASFSAGAEPSEPYIGFRLQALLERGRARIETGDLDGAVEDFVTARALWPELSEPVLLLGKTYHLQGDTARAEAGFEEFHGKTQRKDEFALEVAWLCIKSLREYERGLAWAEKASESAHREALRAQFMSLYLGRAEEGLVAATRAVELDPNLSRAHSALAIALQATDKLDEAIAEHRKAIELDPGQSMPHNNLASILREQGKLEEAVAECRIAIELNPNDSVHRMSLGSAFHDLGKLEEAIAEYRKAIELDPKDALAHNNLGQAFCRQGKLEEAIAEHRKAIELDPKDARHHNSLGVALGFQGKREESIDEYRKAIELDPKFILARRNLGTALRRQGKLLEAIAEFRKAIEIDPDAPESHNDLGSAFRDQGNLEEAIAEYQKVTELNPKSARVRCSLGLVFMNQGRLDEAGAMFRKAIELDPSYAVARNCLGNALLKQSKPGEAEVALRKATELDPKIADFHTNLGIALRDQGKLDESEAAYRKAIEIDPRSHHGYCNYANLLGGQGRLREALAVSAGAVATNAFCQATLVQLPDLFGRLGDMDGGTDIESIAGALKKGLFGSSYLELPASGAPEMERRLKALALALVCNSPARDPDGAVEVARRLAERSDPVGPDGLSFVAEIQFRGGKLPAAIETLERLVSLPGSSQEHGVLLEQCRQAALPDLPTFGSIDAALERPQAAALIPERPERGSSRGVTEASEGREDGSVEGEAERREILEFDPERFEAFRTRVQERGTVGAGLLAYLEARLLQRRGAHREAVAKLEEAIAASPAKAEPYLRLVESLRALSESARAEPRLREALHGGAVDSSGVWDAWWAAAAEAKVSPEEILKLVSQAASATPQSYAADLLWALQRLSEDGAIRINCGGEENRGADGKLWGKDRFALGGRVREARADRSVEGTEDDEIYRTARWFPRGDAAHTAYRIPVPAGRYRLTLGFAEVTSSEAEKRRFDVLLEGRTILDDYEPKVDTAENFTFEQTVEDGHLDIEFVHKVDDPEISAIAIERLP